MRRMARRSASWSAPARAAWMVPSSWLSGGARRSMGRACRLAGVQGREAIDPAHILVAALEGDEELTRVWGVSSLRARGVLVPPMNRAPEGHPGNRNDAPPSGEDPKEDLPPGACLLGLLERLPPGTESTGLLAEIANEASEEIRLLLAQHKITPALFQHSAHRFHDPEESESR